MVLRLLEVGFSFDLNDLPTHKEEQYQRLL